MTYLDHTTGFSKQTASFDLQPNAFSDMSLVDHDAVGTPGLARGPVELNDALQRTFFWGPKKHNGDRYPSG
ncbi:hypothetical protein GCM10025778_35170 [Paeniglutamicibacter antarcticus]|uniref:Uncharacterized protein n=1 Tax=Paeniglutamicibacter antarcticus TaxID=494023 RepID=A0ABP9TRP6_9MICC